MCYPKYALLNGQRRLDRINTIYIKVPAAMANKRGEELLITPSKISGTGGIVVARGWDTAAPEAAGQVAEEEGEGDNPGSFERRAGGALHEHGRGRSPDPEAGGVRSRGGGRSGAGHRAVFLDPNSAGEMVRSGGG